MPYTRTWDETVPPGSAARNTVATLLRNLKVDLRERFESGLIVDYDADPVVIQPAVLGNVTGKLYNVHWSAFSLGGSTNWSVVAGGGYIEDTSVASEMYAPLILPPGAVITEVIFYANPNGGSAMTFNVARTLRSAGSIATLFTDVPSFPGYNGFTTGAVSHTVDGDYIYSLKATTSTNNRLYGATVKYDVDDSRITI